MQLRLRLQHRPLPRQRAEGNLDRRVGQAAHLVSDEGSEHPGGQCYAHSPSLALAHAPKSAGSLRVLLMLFGFAYGIFDQGSMQLALWYSETSANKRTQWPPSPRATGWARS